MFSFYVASRNKSTVACLLLCLGLLAAPLSAQQIELPEEIDVVGGNSSNSRMFWLNYDAADPAVNVAVQLNDDASSYPNLNSFTFVRNTCGGTRVDVVAASTNASQLVVYEDSRGTAKPICGPGLAPCPQRPVGLSTSTEQVVSVATSGAAGSKPSVFTFAPGGSEESCGVFRRNGGALTVGSFKLSSIADTEFAPASTGGLDEGDLLVLVSNPAMIVRVKPADIQAASASGTVFADSRTVFSSKTYSKATPTGLAIVPGDGANILVTLSTGVILNFYLDNSGWKSRPLLASGSMFPNPRGIAAGTRDGVPYIVVSEQSQGRYIRADLANDNGNLSVDGPSVRTIVSPIGAPEGVAINNEDTFLLQCFQPVTAEEQTTGCVLDGTIELHFSRGFEPDWPPRGGRVDAELTLIPDPDFNLDRDLNNGFLPLDPYLPLDMQGKGFAVPPFCRGFESANYPVPQLVLINVDINFAVKRANFVVVTEQAQELLELDGDCKVNGSRIYYHPSEPGGVLFDTTFSCQNPSRSIVENFSPVVLCQDSFHLDRVASANIFYERNTLNDQLRPRIDELKDYVAELEANGVDPAVTSFLQGLLVGFTNPNMGASSAAELKQYFLDTSRKADDGALAIFAQKKIGTFSADGIPPDLYARMLRGFLSLAFYARETGALEEYKPPYAFCQPYTIEIDGVPTGVEYDFELPDVECAAAL
jgi:hypothetical protein